MITGAKSEMGLSGTAERVRVGGVEGAEDRVDEGLVGSSSVLRQRSGRGRRRIDAQGFDVWMDGSVDLQVGVGGLQDLSPLGVRLRG
jgi:hypothetical protein